MPAIPLVLAGTTLFGTGAAATFAAASFTSVAGLAAGASIVGSVATLAGGIAAATGNKDGNKWMQTGGMMMMAGAAGTALSTPAVPASGTPTPAPSEGMTTSDFLGAGPKDMTVGSVQTASDTTGLLMPQATGMPAAPPNAFMQQANPLKVPSTMTEYQAADIAAKNAAVGATENATKMQGYGMLAKAGGDVMSGMALEEQAKWKNDQEVAAYALKREQELRNRALLNAQQTSYKQIGR